MEVGELMVKKKIISKLFLWLGIVVIISIGVFGILVNYNKKISSEAAKELGSLYMSEIMFQMNDHFETIIDMKNNEICHITGHVENDDGDRHHNELLKEAAEDMNFEYLALYQRDGNYETVLGEDAWYRNLQNFISRVEAGEKVATTGYLTSTGSKYIVFGIAVNYEMSSGDISDVMLVGFSVEKLYEYIRFDEFEQMGRNAYISIISTNGSYILSSEGIKEKSFYDYIENFGKFVVMDTKEGIEYIESSMAGRKDFSGRISINGEIQHIYGSPIGAPDDWYFVITMPQKASDEVINEQNNGITHAFVLAGTIVLLLLLSAFVLFLRLTMRQMQAIEEARIEAEVASKAKSVFLSNMSHDIRTPMNAIIGFTNLAEESVKSGDDKKTFEYLDKMKRSSDYLRNIISDVLDMSKIESATLTLNPEPMSISEMINTLVTIANTHASIKSQKLDINIHDIVQDEVNGDYTRINQILVNILSNAVKFTGEGGEVGLEVWQEESVKGDEYISTIFIVTDNGIGMSPQFLGNMFDSFSREESKVRKVEGTGLGLAIAKRLLDMMEGTIEVESKEGEGSRFYIRIDLQKSFVMDNSIVTENEEIKFENMRILLAEDNDFNYDVAHSLLEMENIVSERAENGQVVVDKYCENPKAWDVILMDLRMPIMDGYQATEKIRQFEKDYPEEIHIPIYAVSADVFSDDIEHCHKVGMEGHVSKPIDMDEIFKILRKHRMKIQ